MTADKRNVDEHDLQALIEDASKTSAFLQDRLRVGVRMLKALQTQIEHAATVVDAMESSRASAIEAAERLADIRGLVEHRIEEAVGSAFERSQRRLAAREAALDQVDEQIALADARAEAVTQLVESAEVNIAALAHKSARRATGARKPRRAKAVKAKATVEEKPAKKGLGLGACGLGEVRRKT